MRIILAPDKFKGCLSASQVCQAMQEGISTVDPSIEIDLCPMADGGEGTVDALVAATGGRIITSRVTGPLPSMKVEASMGILGDGTTAVIEMASASGLHLLRPDQHDPTRTTTYGTGELLRQAIDSGCKRIILGIGGSATVDGGIGLAQALGSRFILRSGQVHSIGDRRLTGGDLNKLLRIEIEPVKNVEIIVAADVGNPLTGPDGAAEIFGPQKGATSRQVQELDQGLDRLSRLIGRTDLASAPGAGAAGGLGFAMLAFYNATIKPGATIVMDALLLRERLGKADLCLTGEGKLDVQTLSGKTVIAVARICQELSIPCIALAGALGPGHDRATSDGLTGAFSICSGPMPISESIDHAGQLLTSTTISILRTFLASHATRS